MVTISFGHERIQWLTKTVAAHFRSCKKENKHQFKKIVPTSKMFACIFIALQYDGYNFIGCPQPPHYLYCSPMFTSFRTRIQPVVPHANPWPVDDLGWSLNQVMDSLQYNPVKYAAIRRTTWNAWLPLSICLATQGLSKRYSTWCVPG